MLLMSSSCTERFKWIIRAMTARLIHVHPNGCSYCNVQTHSTKRSVCTCIQATTICVSGLTRQVCTERQVGHLSGSSICLHNQPARFLLCSITALVDTLISPFWDCNHRSALVGESKFVSTCSQPWRTKQSNTLGVNLPDLECGQVDLYVLQPTRCRIYT